MVQTKGGSQFIATADARDAIKCVPPAIVVALGLFASCAFAGLELGAPFSDGAVLQRSRPVPVWGKADANAAVRVEFGDIVAETKADGTGAWRVELPAMDAESTGRTLAVSSGEERIEAKDVLIGEVWFASGQSNMECPIWGGNPRYRDCKGAMMSGMTRLKTVRFVKVPRRWAVEPQPVKARWCAFEPQNFRDGERLGAVAFYFARELGFALGDVPVGIVEASWGGTNIDAWTPRSGYDGCDESIAAVAAGEIHSEWKKEYARYPVTGDIQQPTVLFNGMVAAFAPMAMRGVVWYQGCHNAGESGLYAAKMHALYNGWAREFANDSLALLFVQLVPWKDGWWNMHLAQEKFADEEPNAAFTTTADLGNLRDIHPNDKETVGQRLAALALTRLYGFADLDAEPPRLASAEVKDGAYVLSFTHAPALYLYNDDFSSRNGFEVRDKAGEWHPGRIEGFNAGRNLGREIRVSAQGVDEPTGLRYLHSSPWEGRLYSVSSNLPVAPFETGER